MHFMHLGWYGCQKHYGVISVALDVDGNDGEVKFGVGLCSPTWPKSRKGDNFSRKQGRHYAIDRLLDTPAHIYLPGLPLRVQKAIVADIVGKLASGQQRRVQYDYPGLYIPKGSILTNMPHWTKEWAKIYYD